MENSLKLLRVTIGCRVMLATNLNVSERLTNGIMGEITNIIVPENPNVVSTTLVCFHSSGFGKDAKSHSIYRGRDPKCVPIK